MEDLSKKMRRRSIRNLRRSSSTFVPLNTSVLEPCVTEAENGADLSTIVQNYGSAWAGDENIDPLVLTSSADLGRKNSRNVCGKDSDSEQGASPLASYNSYNCDFDGSRDVHNKHSPGERSDSVDSIEQLRSSQHVEKPDAERSLSLASIEDVPTWDSSTQSLPELDLNQCGSVDEWLGAQSREAWLSSHASPLTEYGSVSATHLLPPYTKQSCAHQKSQGLHEMDQTNWGLVQETHSPGEGDMLNDAFSEHCNGLNLGSPDVKGQPLLNGHTKRCLSPGKATGVSNFESVINDTEMMSLAGNNNSNDIYAVPGPKIRKVTPEEEHILESMKSCNKSWKARPLSDTKNLFTSNQSTENSRDASAANSSSSNSSMNKISSVLGMTMSLAIQSLTSRLEALSSTSDPEGDDSSKPLNATSKEVQPNSSSVSKISVTSKLYPCQSLPSDQCDKSPQDDAPQKVSLDTRKDKHIQAYDSSSSTQLNKAISPTLRKSKKRLSLKREHCSVDDNLEHKKMESSVGTNEILVSEYVNECSVMPSTCTSSALPAEIASAEQQHLKTTLLMDLESKSETRDTAAEDSNLNFQEEAALLAQELSLRFLDDDNQFRKEKCRRRHSSTTPNRRRSRMFSAVEICLADDLTSLDHKAHQDRHEDIRNTEGPSRNLEEFEQSQAAPIKSTEIHVKDPTTALLKGSTNKVNNNVRKERKKRRSMTATIPAVQPTYSTDDTPECQKVSDDSGKSAEFTTTLLEDTGCINETPTGQEEDARLKCFPSTSVTKSNVMKKKGKSQSKRKSGCGKPTPRETDLSDLLDNEVDMEISDDTETIYSQNTCSSMCTTGPLPPVTDISSATTTADQALQSDPQTWDPSVDCYLAPSKDKDVLDTCGSVLEIDKTVTQRRRSERNQRTCKRKSWVLPVASDSSSSIKEKQKKVGRKANAKEDLSLPASTDPKCGSDGSLNNSSEDFEVSEVLEKLYLNKLYQPPPAMRCWETIRENPRNKVDVFTKQRHKRLLTFQEGLSHSRMLKRHHKAVQLNCTSKTQPVAISDGEFKSRLALMDKVLDS